MLLIPGAMDAGLPPRCSADRWPLLSPLPSSSPCRSTAGSSPGARDTPLCTSRTVVMTPRLLAALRPTASRRRTATAMPTAATDRRRASRRRLNYGESHDEQGDQRAQHSRCAPARRGGGPRRPAGHARPGQHSPWRRRACSRSRWRPGRGEGRCWPQPRCCGCLVDGGVAAEQRRQCPGVRLRRRLPDRRRRHVPRCAHRGSRCCGSCLRPPGHRPGAPSGLAGTTRSRPATPSPTS